MPGDVWFCRSAADALGKAARDENAISVVLTDGGETLRVASMTAFGPSVWNSPRSDVEMVVGVIKDSLKLKKEIYVYCDEATSEEQIHRLLSKQRIKSYVAPEFGDWSALGVSRPAPSIDRSKIEEMAFDAFSKTRVDIKSNGEIDGEEITSWWSVMPVVGDVDAFQIGDRLKLARETREDGVILRWRKEDGVDAGVHVIMRRPLTDRENKIVDESWGVVTRLAYGLAAPTEEGISFPTRMLCFDIPTRLAREFREGELPRPGHFHEKKL